MKRALLYIVCFIIVMEFAIFFSFRYGNAVNNAINGYGLENYVNENNLNLPFPYKNSFIGLNETGLLMSNISIFYHYLLLNYKYDDKYNCKYWSYVWLNWWKFHKDNLKLRIISTKNHVFIIMYNKSEYIIADENTLLIRHLKNG